MATSGGWGDTWTSTLSGVKDAFFQTLGTAAEVGQGTAAGIAAYRQVEANIDAANRPADPEPVFSDPLRRRQATMELTRGTTYQGDVQRASTFEADFSTTETVLLFAAAAAAVFAFSRF